MAPRGGGFPLSAWVSATNWLQSGLVQPLLIDHDPVVLNDRQQRMVRALLPGADIEPVWINPLGGATYRVTDSGVSAYLKVAAETLPPSHDPLAEADRLRWVGDRFAVPHVIDTGRRDGYSWLLTADLGGVPASDRVFADHPEQTARSLGQTLRAFHDALSTAQCPWSWQVQERYRGGRQTAEAAELLGTAPPETDLVVSHGDFCAPNVLLNRGELGPAVVDLGKLGIADRAADLGCLVWSLEFNGMSEQRQAMLDAYGFAGDLDHVTWYRDFYTVV